MKFNVQAVSFNADSELIGLVDRKIDKLDKFKDHIVEGEVYLKLENKSQTIKDKTVEIKCHVKGNTLFAKEITKTFEESLDLAVDNMSRQVRRFKEQLVEKK
jgi:putative sigma-54 modulation protein